MKERDTSQFLLSEIQIFLSEKEVMERLIDNLTEHLQKVIKEHPKEIENDTYWRGVKIGLETAIEVALTFNAEEK